jgi:hypothetical protein
MGVTAIKSLVNTTPGRVSIHDHENPTHPGNNTDADPYTTAACDMWIPWCTSPDDWRDQKYITIEWGGQPRYWVWQAAHGDGDFVRYSTSGQYEDPGRQASGFAGVDGDRRAIILDDGSLTIQEKYDPTIPWFPDAWLNEHRNWHMNAGDPAHGGRVHPMGAIGSGEEFLVFHCNFIAKVIAWYNQQSFANPTRVAPWLALPPELKQNPPIGGLAPWQTQFSDDHDLRLNPLRFNFQSDDDLGQFIEGGIHSWLHAAASVVYDSPPLDDPMTSAPFTYFYQLHGLINVYWSCWRDAAIGPEPAACAPFHTRVQADQNQIAALEAELADLPPRDPDRREIALRIAALQRDIAAQQQSAPPGCRWGPWPRCTPLRPLGS